MKNLGYILGGIAVGAGIVGASLFSYLPSRDSLEKPVARLEQKVEGENIQITENKPEVKREDRDINKKSLDWYLLQGEELKILEDLGRNITPPKIPVLKPFKTLQQEFPDESPEEIKKRTTLFLILGFGIDPKELSRLQIDTPEISSASVSLNFSSSSDEIGIDYSLKCFTFKNKSQAQSTLRYLTEIFSKKDYRKNTLFFADKNRIIIGEIGNRTSFERIVSDKITLKYLDRINPLTNNYVGQRNGDSFREFIERDIEANRDSIEILTYLSSPVTRDLYSLSVRDGVRKLTEDIFSCSFSPDRQKILTFKFTAETKDGEKVSRERILAEMEEHEKFEKANAKLSSPEESKKLRIIYGRKGDPLEYHYEFSKEVNILNLDGKVLVVVDKDSLDWGGSKKKVNGYRWLSDAMWIDDQTLLIHAYNEDLDTFYFEYNLQTRKLERKKEGSKRYRREESLFEQNRLDRKYRFSYDK